MGKLRVRKHWKVWKVLRITYFPFQVLASVIVWLVFDVSWHEAWTGELE